MLIPKSFRELFIFASFQMCERWMKVENVCVKSGLILKTFLHRWSFALLTTPFPVTRHPKPFSANEFDLDCGAFLALHNCF